MGRNGCQAWSLGVTGASLEFLSIELGTVATGWWVFSGAGGTARTAGRRSSAGGVGRRVQTSRAGDRWIP